MKNVTLLHWHLMPGRNAQLTFFISLIAFFGAILQVSGQAERETVTQSIQWTSLNSNIKLHEKFSLAVDGQIRFAEFGMMQNQVRAGLEIYVTKKLSIIPVHYSYIWNYQYGKQPASFINNEHRIGQQVSYKHGLGRISMNHRFRTEERFIQVHSKNAENEIVNEGFINKQFRIRYRVLFNIPINKNKMEAGTLYASIWDEVFMSRGKLVTFEKPDQNRIFGGIGYQFSKDFAIQGGFLYQALVKANGVKQENNMGLLLQVNYNFDLSKKVSQ